MMLSCLATACGGASQVTVKDRPPHRSRTAEVGGVTWVSAGALIRKECQRTANTVHYVVPCPTMLPQRMRQFPEVHGCQLEIVGAGGGPHCADVWRGWIVGDGEVLEPGYADAIQHLALQGAPRIVTNPVRAIDGPGRSLPGFRPRVQPRGHIRVAGRLMRWYLVPPATNRGSMFSGHLVLVWNADGHTYAYGFHVLQTFAVARALDLELARHLVAVKPNSRS